MSTNNEWTILEKLLLTQAVYKYGENMWFQVARVLKQHGLIQPQQRQSDFFSQKNCQFQYYLLVENLEAEKQLYRNNDLKNDMPVVVRIARQLYLQRIDEVTAALKKDEEEFEQLANEIDSIKSGHWDEKLKENLPVTNGLEEPQGSNINISKVSVTNNMKEAIVVIEKDDGSLPALEAFYAPILEEKKMIDYITQQENRMKRTSSESSIVLTTNTLKKCRLEDAQVDQVGNSSEDHAISTAISAAITTEVSNIDIKEDALTANTSLYEEINTDNILLEEISIPAPIIPTEIPEKIGYNALDDAIIEDPVPQQQEKEEPVQPAPTIKSTQADATAPVTTADDPLPAAIATENLIKEEFKSYETDTTTEGVIIATEAESIKISSPLAEEPATFFWQQQKPPKIGYHHYEQQFHLEQPTHELSKQQYQQQAVTQLPKIIIPEDSSFSSTLYRRSSQDQPASPISKLHNMMTDEEDFTGSEAATPTSTSAMESKRRLNPNNDQRQKAWQKNINLLWQEIANHKNGTMFMNPIKKSYAPLYDKVVKQPLYLKTIKNRVRDGIVKTTAEFERDIVLMLTNSLMYNKEGTEIYLMALEMLDDVREQIRLFKSADGYSVSLWENGESSNNQ